MIFVSHAFEDQTPVVNDLVRGLKAGGVDVWYSREQLPAGTGYLFDMFNQAIAECDAALIVLTPSYLKSTYAQKELNALHHQHVYADKPIFLLLVGLPAGAILTKYPMISDLYHHRPHASGDMKKTGEELARVMPGKPGKDTPPLAESPVTPATMLPVARQRVPVPLVEKYRNASWNTKRVWRRVSGASLVTGLLTLGTWSAWHTLTSPAGVLVESLADTTHLTWLDPGLLPVKNEAWDAQAHLDGLSRFLQSPDQYRIYLGSRGYAVLKTVESADHEGVVLAYLSPAGQEVLARLWPGGAGYKGCFADAFSKGQIQGLVFRADGTAQGNWYSSPGEGETVVTDSFVIVKK